MKKILIISLLFLVGFCSFQNESQALGLLYSNTVYPVTATGNLSPSDLGSLKKGTSSVKNILYLFEVGDAGINKAALDGHINKINFIDMREKTIFIFYKKFTTTVYGE